MSMWEAFTISFILILLQKMLCVIKPCHWPWIKFFSSGGHKSWHHSRLVAATFHFRGLPRSLQDTVRTRRALVLCFLIKHVFCFTLLTLQCACVWLTENVRSIKVRSNSCVLICGSMMTSYYGRNPFRWLYWPAKVKRHQISPLGGAARDGWSMWTKLSFPSQTFPGLLDHFVTAW